MVKQVANEIVVLRHDEHVGRCRQPVNEQNSVRGAPWLFLSRRFLLKTQQTEAEFVLSRKMVRSNVGIGHAL